MIVIGFDETDEGRKSKGSKYLSGDFKYLFVQRIWAVSRVKVRDQ